MSDKRFILVSGCSSGIGKACALYLSQRGFRVLATVRREQDAQALARDSSGAVEPLLLDVTDAAAIDGCARQVKQIVGSAGLFALVNNAGIAVVGPVECVNIQDWRKQLEVNVIGQVALTQAMLPQLRLHADAAGDARLLFISSISGLVASPVLGPYAASKHAIEAICDSLRLELAAQKIQVTSIRPGPIQSEIWAKAEQSVQAFAVDHPARPIYAKLIDGAIHAAGKSARGALPAEVIAKKVERCLLARRAPARMLVGNSARAAAFFRWLLPVRWFDRAVAREMGAS